MVTIDGPGEPYGLPRMVRGGPLVLTMDGPGGPLIGGAILSMTV